jgi:tight adherence protein B
MRALFIVLLSFALVLCLEGIYHGVRSLLRRRSDELRRRLQTLVHGSTEVTLLRRGRFASTPALASALRTLAPARWTERLLECADSRLTVAQLWGYSAVLAAVSAVLAASVGLTLAPVLVLVLGAACVPTASTAAAAARRSRKISEQLPEALDMMSRSLRAGHASPSAIQLVATEMPEPISLEFGRAFEEQRLGLPLEDAILHMTDRAPSNGDLKIFATSVILHKDTGGNLAELMAGIAETIRARYRFYGKLRALTAEGRAAGLILALLPLAFIVALQFLNPGYLMPLLTEPAGHTALLYGGGTWVVGILWLNRLTKVDL